MHPASWHRLWVLVSIIVGVFHFCFAQQDLLCGDQSRVFSIGSGEFGQLGEESSKTILSPFPIDSSSVFAGAMITMVDTGGGHSLVLSETGQVFSFGSNGYGQLGDGTTTNRNAPVVVLTSGALSGKNIIAISAGEQHSLVLAANGQVFSFGQNKDGQLGDGTTTSRNTPVAVSTSGVLKGKIITAIEAGFYHSLVLSSTGQVFSFGYNDEGQLGDLSNVARSTPVAVSTSGVLNGETIIAIAAGYEHSLVLSESGQVFSFGSNSDGQLGDGTNTNRNTPVAVSTSGVLNGHHIIAISAGEHHSLVLSESGQVFSFGNNVQGQLGDDTVITTTTTPVAVNTSGVLNGHNISSIAAGHSHSLLASESGQVFSFGKNTNGQLGDGTQTSRRSPVAVLTPPIALDGLSGGSEHSLILSASGQVFGFGFNPDGQLGNAKFWLHPMAVSVSTSGVLNGIPFSGIACGRYHTFVLSVTGQVFSFGKNANGQLGDGTNKFRTTPVAVNMTGVLDGLEIVAIAGGESHSLVLSATGEVFSFGSNGYGQLGDGTEVDRNLPVAVNTSGVLNGHNITAIAAGWYHSLVLSATGEVFTFGKNTDGELGDGTDTDRNTPVAVSTSGVLNGLKITAIVAGYSHSLVLSETARVFSFGNNDYGQLGDGTYNSSPYPVAVSTSTMLNGVNIVAIAAGYSHSLVLSATGKVFSFGYNGYGQLGDGTTNSGPSPVAVDTSGVLNGLKITAIAAGKYHSLVLSEFGQAFSFGYNDDGQLGTGTFTDSNVPVAVNTSGVLNGFDITAITAAGDHSHLLSLSFSTITVGEVRDGRSINKQSDFQSETDRVAFNWDSFIGTFSNGQSQNVTTYNVTTIEGSTGRIVLAPRIVHLSAGSEGPVLFFENPTDASLVHNMTYFTTISTVSCSSASVSSNGFRVDTTPPQISEFNVDSELWSVDGNLTITWNDAIDLESGVTEIEVSIIDAATNATLPQSGCEMESTSSSGELNLTWSECGTQYPVATKLRAVMTVMNGAGLNTTRRSESDFQIAGVRITNLVNFDGSSHDVFQACRRAVMEWTSAGFENGTLMEISLVESASEDIVLNITHEPVSVQRNQFGWEPVPGSVSAGQYRIKFQVLTPIDPAPIVLSKTITISAADACITVTSPNTTSKWTAGTEQKIEWTKFGASLSGLITLELLKDDEFISDIGNSISVSNESITWRIPTDLAPSNRYRIRASSNSIQGVMFTTDPFEILPPIGSSSNVSPSGSNALSDTTGDGTENMMTTIVMISAILVIGLVLLCFVFLIVIAVVKLIATRNSKQRKEDHTELSTQSLASQQLFDIDAELAMEDQSKSTSAPSDDDSKVSILTSNMLTGGERALAEQVIQEFETSKTCSKPDISSFQKIQDWLRVSVGMLEFPQSKECGMEMASVLWDTLGTDARRRETMKQHPQLLVLLQACVIKAAPSDWSFLERIQRGMECFDANAKQAQMDLTEELGSGSFGSVHVAKRPDTGEMIAVKVIKYMKRGFTGNSLQQVIDVRKIKREILIMSLFAMDNNPHLIHFIGHQADEMKVLILMARAQGNLKDLLTENRLNRKHQGNTTASTPTSPNDTSADYEAVLLSVRAKLDIAIQVAKALAYLHSFEIAHRDLKSENILLMNKVTQQNPLASVRLIDFGISRATQDAHSTFIQGTVSWAAPEVLQAGERERSPTVTSSYTISRMKSSVTTAVDVYSFAYLLWALLSEREPHSNYGSSVELIKSQVKANANCPLVIPTFEQIPDDGTAVRFDSKMFEGYKALMLDCWQSEANKRPTMAQVVERLNSIQRML